MARTLTPSAPVAAQPTRQALSSLLQALAQVTDLRHARGIRHPVGAVLGLCILTFLSGRQSLTGVHRFAREHPTLLPRLGFARPVAPPVPTLCRLLGAIDPAELQHALGGWLAGLLAALACRRRQLPAVASVDGNISRGAGVHLLNVFLHDLELVLYQAPVEGKQNEISAFKAALATRSGWRQTDLAPGDCPWSVGGGLDQFQQNRPSP